MVDTQQPWFAIIATAVLVQGVNWLATYLKNAREDDAQEHDQTRTAYSDTIRDLRKQIADLRDTHKVEREEYKAELRTMHKALEECKQGHIERDREIAQMSVTMAQMSDTIKHMASRIEQLEAAMKTKGNGV